MIVLALLCLLLAAAAVVFMVAVGTTQVVSFSFFAGDFVTNPIWIFAAGAVAMLLTLAALSFLRRGTARKSAQRHEIKRLRKIEETAAPAVAAPTPAAPAVADTIAIPLIPTQNHSQRPDLMGIFFSVVIRIYFTVMQLIE